MGSDLQLDPSRDAHRRATVSRIFASWNHLDGWLRQIGELLNESITERDARISPNGRWLALVSDGIGPSGRLGA